MSKLDKNQEKVVKTVKGPILVLAGPGSGKTTVITHRLKYLIEEKGIDPCKILVMTFTNNAAKEMQERAIKLAGESVNNVSFGTFHSISLMILRAEKGVSDEDIMQEFERYSIIKKLSNVFFPDMEDKNNFIKTLSLDLSLAQSKKGSLENFKPNACKLEVFELFYQEYRKLIKETGRITFDDMLTDCVDILESDKSILEKWQSKWEYLLVDEYQDSNPIQERELELLAAPQNNLMVVGDDDQSIYGFRGANPKVMLSFPEHFKKTKTIHLSINYRSTDEIITASKVLINNNSNRYAKEPSGVKGIGPKLFIKKESNAEWQGRTIVKEINKLKDEGVSLSQMAIIYRTNREAGSFVETLHRFNIPFVVKENIENIYEHWIAKDIFSYIQLALGYKNEELLKTIINKPKRYIEKNSISKTSPFSIEELKIEYDSKNKSYICDALDKLELDITKVKNALDTIGSFEAVNYILENIGYMKHLEDKAQEMGTSIDEWKAIVDELSNAASNHKNINDWFSYIKEYTNEIKNGSKNKEEDAVNLMTMHGAKGLEFEVVFVPNLVEGQVPYVKAKTVSEIEEERRLFYVAMTRAKKHLYILSVRTLFGKEVSQSRFIKEITKGLERIKLDEAKKLIIEHSKTTQKVNLETEISEMLQDKKIINKTFIPTDLIKDTPMVHKDFGEGFLQEHDKEKGKFKVFFPLFGKIMVLDESFCSKMGIISFPKEKQKEKVVE